MAYKFFQARFLHQILQGSLVITWMWNVILYLSNIQFHRRPYVRYNYIIYVSSRIYRMNVSITVQLRVPLHTSYARVCLMSSLIDGRILVVNSL